MNVLVIDVGGTSVKLWHTAHEEHLKFDSGKELTPEQMVEEARDLAGDWEWEGIALGLPCRVSNGRPVEDPQNLGPGWVGFNYSSAFGCPVRIMNDAAMQALGSYDGGRMLFLSLGTGVGSAYIAHHLILSLDLGRISIGKQMLYELLGEAGFEKLGPKKYQAVVNDVVPSLKTALMADYVVLGGGSVKKIEQLPDSVRRGHNRTVVEGGRKLWEELPDPTEQQESVWKIF
ncbi:MAG: ROK family protein [Planctomycetota bacterium]|nr:MAG: ROK family protein [Planctomycetota bacterium]